MDPGPGSMFGAGFVGVTEWNKVFRGFPMSTRTGRTKS